MIDNSENNKRIAKNTLVLYIRMLITMAVGFYTSRVVLANLGVKDYGLYSVVGGIVVVLSFMNGAMAASSQRFLNVEMGKKDDEKLKKVFSNSIIIHLLTAIIVLILSESIGLWFLNTYMNFEPDRINAANLVYQFSVVSLFVSIMSVPYNAAIIAHERMSAFAYVSIVEVIFKLLIALLISLSPIDRLIFYAFCIMLVGIIIRIIYGVYCKRNFIECRNVKYEADKTLFKSMLSFSLWTVFGNLAFILHTQGVAILLNLFFNTAVNAAQGVANQVNGIVKHFVQNFMTATKPQIVKSYASGNLQSMHELLLSGSRISFFLVLAFVVPLFLEAPTILNIWLKEVPIYSASFVRAILLVTLFDSFNSILNAAKGATGEIKVYMIVQTSISALHIPVSYILFKFGYEPYWAMIVYCILVIILQITRILFVCKAISLSLKVFVREVVLVCLWVLIISSVIPGILYLFLPSGISNLIIICFVSVLTTGLSVLYVGLTSHERMSLYALIKNKFLKR